MIIAIDLGKQQELHANPKLIQQISFTGNLNKTRNTTLFIAGKTKKNYFGFFTKNHKNFVNLFDLIYYKMTQHCICEIIKFGT